MQNNIFEHDALKPIYHHYQENANLVTNKTKDNIPHCKNKDCDGDYGEDKQQQLSANDSGVDGLLAMAISNYLHLEKHSAVGAGWA